MPKKVIYFLFLKQSNEEIAGASLEKAQGALLFFFSIISHYLKFM